MPFPDAAPPRLLSGSQPGDEGFALYIHWPWCLSKCPYCDFNSHQQQDIDHRRWHNAMLADLDYAASQVPAGRALTSIFFGGGTPSLMDPETVAALISRATTLFPAPDCEITLEANPGTLDAGRFAAFASAGVNRLSLGIQSLDDQALQFLQRHHDSDQARQAIDLAARLFARFSIDLIYALPGQSPGSWENSLSEALNLLQPLGGSHLSLYQLTIEQGTRFHHDHARGAFTLPEEDPAAELYTRTAELMEAAGMPAYEVSNHARPGSECRHNLTYWRGGDYLAVGPGAHGRLTTPTASHPVTVASSQWKAPSRWLEQVEQLGHGQEQALTLTPEQRGQELLLMGLRLLEGLPEDRFHRLSGLRLADFINQDSLAFLRRQGLLKPDMPLTATPEGRLCLNALIAELAG